MNKKAQSEIITTVLIILLVLAAIVIVWQVVQGTIKKGAGEVERQTDCIGITLDIEKASVAAGEVKVRRGTGGPTAITVYAAPEEAATVEASTTTAELGIATITLTTLQEGKEVKVGAKLEDGTLCSPIASQKATA